MYRIVTLATLTVASLLSPAVHADPLLPLDRQFEAKLGVFFLDTDTTLRVDGNNRDIGTEVNLENELGIDSGDRFRVDGYWRFFPRHKVRFMYFNSSSDATRRLTRNIEFGGETFPINASASVNFDVTIFELAYEYSFMKRDNFELAGTIGLHNLGVEAGISAQISGGGGSAGTSRDAKADGDGPLPVLGLRGIWALNDNWYIDGQMQFFALSFDNYDGDLQDYQISLNWYPWKNVGFGLGYNHFTTQLDVEKDHFLGTLRFEYGGPLLFVAGAF